MNPENIWSTPVQHLSLEPQEVHVFAVDLEEFLSEADDLRALLSKEELQRAERFVSSVLSDHYIVSHAILRKILAQYLKLEPQAINIVTHAQGKPGLMNKELEFNMSHTRGVALYAISLNPVGIDIELLGRDVAVEEIAERFFARSEYEALVALPEAQRQKAFYQCWTLKEAFIKALGEGLIYGLDRFEVDFGASTKCLKNAKDSLVSIEEWTLQPIIYSESTAAALAVRGKMSKLKQWQFSNPR